MTDQSIKLLSSDLDAFRSDGTILTTSITFSGNVGIGASQTQTSSSLSLSNGDFYQVLFENSNKHSGKWRELSKEDVTYILDSNSSVNFVAGLYATISSGNISFTGILPNFSGAILTLQSTVITFRLVAYDSTLL